MRRAPLPLAGDGLVAASGIVELTPADQVVTVRTEMLLADLRAALREAGQDLPLADFTVPWRSGRGPTLKDALDWNLPHTLDGQAGNWRDWTLGGVIETAEGLVGKSGARVVKSVAGYDVHRLLIGARGTLGRLKKVHLRTIPAGALPSESVLEGELPASEVGAIVRVRRTDFESALGSVRWHLADLATATLWTDRDPRFPESRVWLPEGPFVVDADTARFMRRAKAIFDPDNALPPLGIEER